MRGITAQLVAALVAAVLAVPGCAGPSGSLSAAPAFLIPTAKSVSPGSLFVPPMPSTAVLPALTSASTRHTNSAIQPVTWTRLPGGATFVAAGPNGALWMLSDVGTGANRSIWRYVNGVWTNVSGGAVRLSVAPDGTLWAMTAAGGIYAYDGSTWRAIGAGVSDISAAADGSIYAISNLGGNTNGRAIWHYSNGAWSQLPGAAVRVAASWDTGSYPGKITPGGIWTIDALNEVYYYTSGSGFIPVESGMVDIAPTTNGGLFALRQVADSSGGHPIYYDDLSTQSWTQQPGAAVVVATNTANVYVVAATGSIYSAQLTPPAPPVAASITFTGPSGEPHVLGTQSTGYQLIGDQPYTFTAAAFDGHGNPITGSGAPTFTVRSGSAALVVTPVSGNPNAFTVRARTFSSTPVALTVTASNSSASLAVACTTIQELWVANTYNKTITAYAGSPPTQIVKDTISTGAWGPGGLALDKSGNMWVAAGTSITAYAGTTQIPADTVTVSGPTMLAFDSSGVLWVSNESTPSPEGSITAYLGTTQLPADTITNPQGSLTGLWNPRGLAFDSAGTLWVSSSYGSINTITAYSGATQVNADTIEDGTGGPFGLAFDGAGVLWVANNYRSTITAYQGTSQITADTISSGLNQPAGLAFDGSGHLWVSNSSTGVNGSTVVEYAGTSQIAANTISAGLSGPTGIVFTPPAVLPPASPPPTTTPAPTASPVVANPSSLAFSNTGATFSKTVSMSQAGYAGAFALSGINTAIATAAITGSTITVTPVAAGSTSLHVVGGGSQSVDIPITVATSGSVVASPSSLNFLNAGSAFNQTVALSQSGYSGGFTLSGINTSIATATVSGSTVTVTPVSSGTTTLRATGGSGQFVDMPIGVTVSNIIIHAAHRGVR